MSFSRLSSPAVLCCCCLPVQIGIRLREISHSEHKINELVRARSASLLVHMNLFWQQSRNGNLHGSGMLHTTTASLKPYFRTLWMVGDAVVGRGNAEWTTPKSGHPCPCQNCSQGPPAEKKYWKRISAESSLLSP